MALIAFEFLAIIGSIIVGLLALSGAIVCINYAWNLFLAALKGK